MTALLKEAAWTALTRKLKLDLDDGALAKALARAEKARPDEQAAALEGLADQLRKQAAALDKRKKELDDKAFGEAKARLRELLVAAEQQLKDLRTAEKAKAADGDEEADTPALLTSKMVPLLRELRKGESTMHALICTAGKNAAVLVMRRSIASSRRKLLAEAVDAKGGARYVDAQCLLENKVLTFVVKSAAGGLALKIREALLRQTGMRLKVRVRGEDGAAEEHGEDAADAAEVSGAKAGDGASRTPDPLAAAYAEQLRRLDVRLKAALHARHPESARLGALRTQAADRANAQRDYAGAIRLLGEMAKLLAGAPAGSATQPSAAAAGAARGIPAGLVNLQKARLAWVQTRQAVKSQLDQLERCILDEYQGDDELASVKRDVRQLDQVMAALDEELIDTLDEALQATDPTERRNLQQLAREQLDGYSAYVADDDFIGKLDANPFTPLKIRETVTRSAAALGKALN